MNKKTFSVSSFLFVAIATAYLIVNILNKIDLDIFNLEEEIDFNEE